MGGGGRGGKCERIIKGWQGGVRKVSRALSAEEATGGADEEGEGSSGAFGIVVI